MEDPNTTFGNELFKRMEDNKQLIEAVEKGDFEKVKYLQERGVDVNQEDSMGRTTLEIAVLNNDLNMVKYLVDNYSDDDFMFEISKGQALLKAVVEDHLDIVNYLVEKAGADVNYQDQWGFTALMGAVRNDNLNITKYLVEKGADIYLQTEQGYTALDMVTPPQREEGLPIANYLKKIIIEKRLKALKTYAKHAPKNDPLHKLNEDMLRYIAKRSMDFGFIRGKKVRLHWDQGKQKFYYYQ